MPWASGDNIEALAQGPEQEPATYHTANLGTVVFLAPHTLDGHFAIPLRFISTCGKCKWEQWRDVCEHRAELGSNVAFSD